MFRFHPGGHDQTMLGVRLPRRPSGQAAVETALTMPLTLFMVLGCIQLFMLMQAKVMAQYAVFQAARMGSVSNGRCDIMLHAAILAFSPAVRSLMSGTVAGGSPGAKLATVFTEFRNNDYNTFHGWSGDSIVWIIRESPRFPGSSVLQAREHFDNPLVGGQPVRLELRAIFWAPLIIPFADWVFSRMELAHLGLQPYTNTNPLAPTQTANWGRTTGFSLDNPIAAEYARRLAAKHYVFPIEVTYTMRMMSPVMLRDFAQPNCRPTPGSL
jgi:hypothetical protein